MAKKAAKKRSRKAKPRLTSEQGRKKIQSLLTEAFDIYKQCQENDPEAWPFLVCQYSIDIHSKTTENVLRIRRRDGHKDAQRNIFQMITESVEPGAPALVMIEPEKIDTVEKPSHGKEVETHTYVAHLVG